MTATKLSDLQTLAKLLRSRISREERKSRSSDEICAPGGVASSSCWLCDNPFQAGIEVVLSLTTTRAPSTCSNCFLLLYLRFRPLIDGNPFDEFCKKIKHMLEMSEVPPSDVGIFVNQRSMRSFVLLSLHLEDESGHSNGEAKFPSVTTRKGSSCDVSSNLHWACEACTLINAADARLCSACGRRNPHAVQCPHCQALLIPSVVASAQDASIRYCKGRNELTVHSRGLGPPPLLFCDTLVSPANRSTPSTNHIVGRVSAQLRPAATPVQHALWVCTTCTTINCQATWCCDMCFQNRSIECKKCTFINTRTNGTILGTSDACTMCGGLLLENNVVDPCLFAPLGQHGALHAITEAQRSHEIVQSEQRLKQRIAATGVAKIVPQRGDGNCLFRCIATSLFGTPDLHLLVRQLVVQRLRANKHEYVHYVDDQPWDSYVNSMEEPGTWGDELCLHAAAAVFQCRIAVVSGEASNWLHQFRPPELTTGAANEVSMPQVLIAYTAPVHFDTISIAAAGLTSTEEVLKRVLSSTLALLDEESQWSDAATELGTHGNDSNEAKTVGGTSEWEVLRH